jgi:uncharacterized membrane protein
MEATATETVERPAHAIRKITTDDIHAALNAGWADFRAAPRFGLFFGGVYALIGILALLLLWLLDQPFWIVLFAFAFPLIGPFVAIGLYEVSRRRETGLPLDWSEILDVVWRQRHRQLPAMAFIVLAVAMFWMWSASMLIAIVLGRMSNAIYTDYGSLLMTGNGVALLIIGTLLGGAIAFFLFCITAVSLPMLLDHDIDYVTAMSVSIRSVQENPVPMLLWAGIIAAGLIASMIPFFLGLIVVLPVLGHATWHVYRRVVDQSEVVPAD